MRSDAQVLDAWRMLIGIGQAARVTAAQRCSPDVVPFTLVGGFLGSGKTTLLTNVLSKRSAARIAVLINDFGSISIDAALVRNRTHRAIELVNGCVCCELSTGLANVLAEQLAHSAPPDAIILEASGIAEPLGILHVALSNPGLRAAGLITVVDAATVQTQVEDAWIAPTIERQISAADIVILNKADLAGPHGLAASRRIIRDINREARIIEATFAEVPPQILLDTELHAAAGVAAQSKPRHQHDFRSWAFTSDQMLDARLLCELASGLPKSILRAKGFIRIAQDPATPYLLQVVGRRWSLTREGRWDGPERRSEIVFVGCPGADDLTALDVGLRRCEIN